MHRLREQGLGWISEIKRIAYRAGVSHAAYLVVHLVGQLAILKWITRRARKKNAGIRAVSLLENFGDIVACEPVVKYLRKKYPDEFIVWCVRKPFCDLVKFNPNIDRVITLTCLTEWIWLSRFRMFDSIVDLHLPGRVCVRCKIPLTKKDGNSDITFDNYYDVGSLLTAFSQSAGLPALNEAPTVYIPEDVKRKVDRTTSMANFVVFHCVSNEEVRDWPAEKWKELAEKVQGCGVSIVEVGTSSLLSKSGLSGYLDLCGQLSLLETAEVIRRSSLFVGVDSGPAHCANALGVFGVILLGRYHSFDRYLPYSGNYADRLKAELIYSDGPVSSIEVRTVFNAVKRNLGMVSAMSHVA